MPSPAAQVPLPEALDAFFEAVDADPAMIVYPGFERCILGIAERCAMEAIMVYDHDAMVEQLLAEGLSYDDAVEHISFNILGGFVGPRTPLILTARFAAGPLPP